MGTTSSAAPRCHGPIRKTVIHEVAHHFGENRPPVLEELGGFKGFDPPPREPVESRREGGPVSRAALGADPVAPAQPVGRGLGPAFRLARLRSPRHHQQRLRRHPRTPGRVDEPRRRHGARRGHRRGHRSSRCRPISKTGSATIRRRWPRRYGSRSTWGWRVVRSRISPVGPRTRSTTSRGRRSGWRRHRRPRTGPARLVLTGRAENYLHGVPDLADTIARLQAFQRAGADVLYAPGLTRARRHPPAWSPRAPARQRPGPSG